jgi:hypothetical protein
VKADRGVVRLKSSAYPNRRFIQVTDPWLKVIASARLTPAQAMRLAAQLQRWALGFKRGKKR